jgi:hypothetical protein
MEVTRFYKLFINYIRLYRELLCEKKIQFLSKRSLSVRVRARTGQAKATLAGFLELSINKRGNIVFGFGLSLVYLIE